MKSVKQRYHYSVILLRELVRTDFKLRYQGSALGYVWSLLRPLLLFITLYFVFSVFMKFGSGFPHYAVYLLLGVVLWNYFAEVTSGSVGAIVGKGDLLRKINFPKYVIIFAGSFSALINLGLNFIVIGIFMVFTGIVPTTSALLLIPIIFELFVVSIGVAFFLSALYVKFRDITYIWEVVMQAGFYATPILYPLSRIPNTHHLREIMMLNPLAQLTQDARHVLVTPVSATISQVYNGRIWPWFIPIGVTVIIAVAAGWYFRSQSRNFAEDI